MTLDLIYLFFIFFFSSRRRHTRFDCDWSSDVCSSDLSRTVLDEYARLRRQGAASSPLRVLTAREREIFDRSEEHTSELQSQSNLVCRLLLEKKKKHAGTYQRKLRDTTRTTQERARLHS